MNGHLHVVSQAEADRSQVITKWLNSFRSPESRRTMLSALRAVARAAYELDANAPVDINLFPWEKLSDLEVFEVVQERIDLTVGRVTARKYQAAVRSLLRHMARLRVVDYEEALRTLQATRLPRDVHRILPDLPLDEERLSALLRVCRQDPSPVRGCRDMAMLALMATTGARRAELVGLRTADINFRDKKLRFGRVKGGDERDAALHPNAVPYLKAWIELRGSSAGPLFPSLRKGGRLQETALSPHQFWKVVKQRVEEAGLGTDIAPHDFRRWFVSEMLTQGNDHFIVCRAVGHRSVQTTMKYDRRPLQQLRTAVDTLPLPALEDLIQSDAAGSS